MPRLIRAVTVAALATLFISGPAPAFAQGANGDLKKEIDALKVGQQEILKQLDEIKKAIQARPAAPAAPSGPNVKDVVFSLGTNPVKGDAKAKLTLLEFTDYQCPFCAKYAKETSPKIKADFVDTGKIRYVKMDLPLAMHPKAFDAAEAVRCAGDQGKFWEMNERLFENAKALEPWVGHAEAIGIKVPEFEACMSSDKHAEAIRADMKEAAKAGFTGTPSFMLALTDPKDPKKVKGIVAMVGAKPYDAFKADIEKALAAN